MRKIAEREKSVILYLFNKAGLVCDLDLLTVEPMSDGGMGSLRITSNSIAEQRLRESVAECWFKDIDGVPVIASLNLDQNGQPFEVDVWKVDYSELQRWPQLNEISDVQPQDIQ